MNELSPIFATAKANPPALENVRIGIVGLGYVGLPLAVYMARHFPVVGFDVNKARISELDASTVTAPAR